MTNEEKVTTIVGRARAMLPMMRSQLGDSVTGYAEKGIWFMLYPVAGVLTHHFSGDWACTRIIDNAKDDDTFDATWHEAANAAIEKALTLI